MSKKVLNDHKRIGSTLIAPMMTIGNMQRVSWYEDALPEFIWVAIINNHLGYDSGIQLFAEVSKILLDLDIFEKILGYCTLSSHSQLSQKDKNTILS